MAPTLEIIPVRGPVTGTIRPPGSKSLTNRALILAALAQGRTRLTGVLDSVDTQVMIASLRRLGLGSSRTLAPRRSRSRAAAAARRATAPICSGKQRHQHPLSHRAVLHRAGTIPARRQCPDARAADPTSRRCAGRAGVAIRCELGTDCPPVLIDAKGLPGGELGGRRQSVEPVSERTADGGAVRPERCDVARAGRAGLAPLCRYDDRQHAAVRGAGERARGQRLPDRGEALSRQRLRHRAGRLGRELLLCAGRRDGRRHHRRGAEPRCLARRRRLRRSARADGLPGRVWARTRSASSAARSPASIST